VTNGRSGLSAVRTVGGLVPGDLLGRVVAGQDLAGLSADDFHLELGVTPREAANRAWSVLVGAWTGYRDALAKLPDGDRATGLTREKWLSVLLRELGFGRVPVTSAGGITVEGRSFPVSHRTDTVPIHLLGWGVDLDRKTPGLAGAADRAPHAMVQELLNRSDQHLWAILANGGTLRLLRDSSNLVGQAYVEFDLEAIFDGQLFSDFVALFLLAHQTRFEPVDPEAGPGDCWLERWRADAVETGARALGQLRDGVKAAIESLGTGFLQHPGNVELRARLEPGGGLDLADYHRALLRLVYRLLFCFVAEDRGLLLDPTASDIAKARYIDWFSTARLRRIASRRRGTRHADLWQALSLVIDGLGSDDGRPELGLPGIGGLFEHGPVDVVTDHGLANDALLAAVRHLCVIQPKEGGPRRNVDYQHLGAEELGGIYESLLELVPRHEPVTRTFTLETLAGNERKSTGSHYTPTPVVDCLVDATLDPLLDEAEVADDPEAALLSLTVCDPACGSGHFLVAAARRLAHRLARARADGAEPTVAEAQQAMHDVVTHCIYGVDLNPMAAELAKVSLWLEAHEAGKPLSFLDHHIKIGNALLGTSPALLAAGIPDEALVPLESDDKGTAISIKKRNRAERAGQGDLFSAPVVVDDQAIVDASRKIDALSGLDLASVHLAQRRTRELDRSPELRRGRELADLWCAAFLAPALPGSPAITSSALWDPDGHPASSLAEDLAHRFHLFHWWLEFPSVMGAGGFDCVIGNPPFLSPLSVSGSRVTKTRNLCKFVRGSLGGPKADDSSYFLLLARDLTKPTGRYGMVLPDSFLSAADSAPVRGSVVDGHDLALVWRGDGSEFEAAVTTIIVSFAPVGSCTGPRRMVGPSFQHLTSVTPPWSSRSWSALVAEGDSAIGLIASSGGRTLADLCSVTADYRDQYYGLRGAVVEAPDDWEASAMPPLVTTGLIDPLACYWGTHTTKFDKVKYERPVVVLDRLEAPIRKWAESRRVPKILVATQGKMVELVIDVRGEWLPCVPVISIMANDETDVDLRALASILLSPAAFDYFRATKLGSGLSTGAIKVSAGDLRAMPAPKSLASVDRAGRLLDDLGDEDQRHEFRRLMNEAFGLPPEVGEDWDRTLVGYLDRSRGSTMYGAA